MTKKVYCVRNWAEYNKVLVGRGAITFWVDEKSWLIVSNELTDNQCGDDKSLPKLLDSYQGSRYQVSADGAYDSHVCYNHVDAKGAKATIPPQPNPKHQRKKKKGIRCPRDQVAFAVQTLGRKKWKQDSGYHRQSLVETTFYRYKHLINDRLWQENLRINKRKHIYAVIFRIKCSDQENLFPFPFK